MSSSDISTLCKQVHENWPNSLPEDGWYITVFSSLIASGKYELCADVHKYLLATTHTTPAARTHLHKSITDMLMKLWVLVGIPLIACSLPVFAKVERDAGLPLPNLEEQVSMSDHVGHVQLNSDVEQHGYETMLQLYRKNLHPIMSTWGSYEADFQWLEKGVVYGMFLADTRVLEQKVVSCLNIAGIMCQGLEAPTMWHVRGLRRLDVSVEDAEVVCDVVKRVAGEFGGKGDIVGEWFKAKDVVV